MSGSNTLLLKKAQVVNLRRSDADIRSYDRPDSPRSRNQKGAAPLKPHPNQKVGSCIKSPELQMPETRRSTLPLSMRASKQLDHQGSSKPINRR